MANQVKDLEAEITLMRGKSVGNYDQVAEKRIIGLTDEKNKLYSKVNLLQDKNDS